MMVKLPVFDVLGRAFSAPFKFAWPLLPFYIAVIIVALALVGLGFASGVVPNIETGGMATMTWQSGIAMSVLFLTAYMVFVSVAVLTHRVAADVEHQWQLAMPVVRYFMIALILGVVGIVFYVGGFAIIFAVAGAEMAAGSETTTLEPSTAFVMVAFVIMGVAIGARLFLALPAAALERRKSISLAWRVSQGNTLRLLSAWILYLILMFAINVAAFLIVGGTEVLMQSPNVTGDAGDAGLLGAFGAGWLIVNVVVNYYVTVAGATFLTYSLTALLPNDPKAQPVANEAVEH